MVEWVNVKGTSLVQQGMGGESEADALSKGPGAACWGRATGFEAPITGGDEHPRGAPLVKKKRSSGKKEIVTSEQVKCRDRSRTDFWRE